MVRHHPRVTFLLASLKALFLAHCYFIYINDLSDDLSSNPKLFADDTSLFSVVHDKNTSAKELNNAYGKLVTGAINGK